MTTEQEQNSSTAAEPFWLFDRAARELVRRDGYASIYLPHCDNSSDLLANLLWIASVDSPMPAGGYEDLLVALGELFGERIMIALAESSCGDVVHIPSQLGVDDMEAYFEGIEVRPERLAKR